MAAFSARAQAELRWEHIELEISPSSSDTIFPAEFRFKNPGPGAVEIKEVRPDCGCVVSTPDTRIYRPGESGTIPFVFKPQAQIDRRDVPIEVTTSVGGKLSRTVLVLHVRLHDAVPFSEKFVYWRENQPLEPRTVFVTLKPDERLTVKAVSSDSSAFAVALTKTSDPGKYTLKIRPPAKHGRAFATITVTTTSAKDSRPIDHQLIARVW